MKQRQEVMARAIEIKTVPKRLYNGSSDKNGYDNDDTIESQDSWSNDKADPDEPKDILAKTTLR